MERVVKELLLCKGGESNREMMSKGRLRILIPTRDGLWLTGAMKFAICNETFQDWPIEKVLGFCADAGYDAVEIAPFTLANRVGDLSPLQRQGIRDAAATAGVEISGIHWVLARTEGFHLTHPDIATRQRTSDYLVDLVDCCADLGGGFMVLGSPKQRDLKPGVGPEQGRAWAAEVLASAVRRAEDRGVTICLEPLAPAETNFINTAEEAVRFAGQFCSPGIRIILDVKAMCSEALDIPTLIQRSSGSLAYFHANDRNLKGPGFGDVDFRPIAKALRDAAYDGFVSVEVFDYSEGPEVIARRSLSYLHTCFRDAGYTVRKGRP
jgi:sugar phosphate isomerase/epimerase